MRSPVATRTTPTLRRYGCRYQKRESCRHDWFDEASRAIREKIEDKGSGRSSGKHAHVVTCTSPLQRTSEPNKIRRPPRMRTWVARQSTCDAHRQRCTTPASMETIRSTPLHMSIVDRTDPSTAGMVDGHHGSWTRHQGRNLDGTRVVVRQQRRLTALDMSPCGLPGSSHVVNALRCESVVVDVRTTAMVRIHGAVTYAGVTRDASAGQILRPQIPVRGDVDETGSSCSRPLT